MTTYPEMDFIHKVVKDLGDGYSIKHWGEVVNRFDQPIGCRVTFSRRHYRFGVWNFEVQIRYADMLDRDKFARWLIRKLEHQYGESIAKRWKEGR